MLTICMFLIGIVQDLTEMTTPFRNDYDCNTEKKERCFDGKCYPRKFLL
jgi:hypothetical protein